MRGRHGLTTFLLLPPSCALVYRDPHFDPSMFLPSAVRLDDTRRTSTDTPHVFQRISLPGNEQRRGCGDVAANGAIRKGAEEKEDQ